MTPEEARACIEAFHNAPDMLDDWTSFLHGWEACLKFHEVVSQHDPTN